MNANDSEISKSAVKSNVCPYTTYNKLNPEESVSKLNRSSIDKLLQIGLRYKKLNYKPVRLRKEDLIADFSLEDSCDEENSDDVEKTNENVNLQESNKRSVAYMSEDNQLKHDAINRDSIENQVTQLSDHYKMNETLPTGIAWLDTPTKTDDKKDCYLKSSCINSNCKLTDSNPVCKTRDSISFDSLSIFDYVPKQGSAVRHDAQVKPTPLKSILSLENIFEDQVSNNSDSLQTFLPNDSILISKNRQQHSNKHTEHSNKQFQMEPNYFKSYTTPSRNSESSGFNHIQSAKKNPANAGIDDNKIINSALKNESISKTNTMNNNTKFCNLGKENRNSKYICFNTDSKNNTPQHLVRITNPVSEQKSSEINIKPTFENKHVNFETPQYNEVPSAKFNSCSNVKSITPKPDNIFLKPKEPCNEKPNVKYSISMPSKRFRQYDSIFIKGCEYSIMKKIGEGGSSEVYQVLDLKMTEFKAVKQVNLAVDPITANGYMNEIELLSKLQTSNRVIKMFDYEIVYEQKVLYVILELGDIDLSILLRNATEQTSHLPEHVIIFYWKEMLMAVKHIHDNGIIHSDLKPGNFLLVKGHLKLIDFGIASVMADDMTSVIKNSQTGTFNYISPEALIDSQSGNSNSPIKHVPKIKISYKSDVWSLGCILYNLVYRRTPFQHIAKMWVKMEAITDPNYRISYPEVPHCSPTIISTIQKCLTYDIKKRPSVNELLSIKYNV